MTKFAYTTRPVFLAETVNGRTVAIRTVDAGTLVEVTKTYRRLLRITLPSTLFEQDVTIGSVTPA